MLTQETAAIVTSCLQNLVSMNIITQFRYYRRSIFHNGHVIYFSTFLSLIDDVYQTD